MRPAVARRAGTHPSREGGGSGARRGGERGRTAGERLRRTERLRRRSAGERLRRRLSPRGLPSRERSRRGPETPGPRDGSLGGDRLRLRRPLRWGAERGDRERVRERVRSRLPRSDERWRCLPWEGERERLQAGNVGGGSSQRGL